MTWCEMEYRGLGVPTQTAARGMALREWPGHQAGGVVIIPRLTSYPTPVIARLWRRST
jgi:hypothetical protein